MALLFDMIVDLADPLDHGAAVSPRRILYPALGGTFCGERLHGDVIAGGGDWATFHAGGRMDVDVRLTLRTYDGALIDMRYAGRMVMPDDMRRALRGPVSSPQPDPARYYFRTCPLFATGSAAYDWLNAVVSVGTGYLTGSGVGYRVFALL